MPNLQDQNEDSKRLLPSEEIQRNKIKRFLKLCFGHTWLHALFGLVYYPDSSYAVGGIDQRNERFDVDLDSEPPEILVPLQDVQTENTAFAPLAEPRNLTVPPEAVDDTYDTDEDHPPTITATGVLSNDSDADGNSLVAILDGDVSNGSLTLNSDGSFVYTPTTDFNGTNTFTYRANDGQNASNTATVTITVNAVNDALVAGDGSGFNVLTSMNAACTYQFNDISGVGTALGLGDDDAAGPGPYALCVYLLWDYFP